MKKKERLDPPDPNSIFEEAQELPMNYVFFVPLSEDTITLLLPILPNNVLYGSNGYRNFLSDFRYVFYEINSGAEDPVGKIWVNHKRFSFYCYALDPFIEAISENKHVTIIPYCMESGIPTRDIYGAVVPVSSRSEFMTAMDKVKS